jgi:ribonuclease T1
VPGKPARRLPPRTQLVLAICLVALAAYFWWRGQEDPVGAPPPADQPAQATRHEAQDPANDNAKPSPLVKSAVIRNLDGEVVYRGQIDLAETVARIQAGGKLRQFRNDGTTFQNRERRLPRQPSGYYREWVHPTRGLAGPGPQRIVTGNGGEFYYTPDHYETFERLEVRQADGDD